MTRSLFPGYRQRQQGGNDKSGHSSHDFSQIQDVTLDYLRQMEANSAFFGSGQTTCKRCIPQFSPAEVQLGVMLGQGEFGVLLRVTGIQLLQSGQDGAPDGSCCSSFPLDHHHRLASSSINLPAIADLSFGSEDKDVYNIHTGSVTKSGSMAGSATRNVEKQNLPAPPPHHRATQSVTISKLAHPSPLPIEQRTHMAHPPGQQNSAFDLCGKGEEEQVLRQDLAKRVTTNPMSPSLDKNENQKTTQNGRPARRLLALKQVRKDLYPKKKLEAAKDLAREAIFLARLHHDNIITLRGVVSQPGRLEFGMLLDRLGLTLSEEVLSWQERQVEIVAASHVPVVTPVLEAFSSLFQKSESAAPSLGTEHGNRHLPQQQKQQPHYTQPALQLLGERVLALWDVSRGMQYLHRHKILFRDLKTENVGTLFAIGVDGDSDLRQQHQRMQIFDFGLAKECKRVDCVGTFGGNNEFYNTYHMTGLTGTLRIMAPEVIQCLPYGLPADVYSFGVCMWEVFSGTKDNSLTAAEICQGQRPVIPSMDRHCGAGMPLALQSLLQRCWSHDALQRPTFGEVTIQLHEQLLELQRLESSSKSRNSSRCASPLQFPVDALQPPQGVHKPLTQAAAWQRLGTIQSSSALEESPLISVTDT
jgi:serine/threonine protein kinase